MDEHRFDSLTRRLATATSRRTGVRALAALGASLVAVARGRGAAAQEDWFTRTWGESCWDSDQCVAADAPLVCADNGTDGALHCCTYEGGRCGDDAHCCGANGCFAGFCQARGGGSGGGGTTSVAPGGACANTAQCNRDQTGAICEFTDSTGDSRCCWYEGSFCTSGAQCCGARACINGVCQFTNGGSGSGGGNGRGGIPVGTGATCTWEGCPCVLWRDPSCRASCQLNDPCDWGLVCNARTSDDVGTCIRA